YLSLFIKFSFFVFVLINATSIALGAFLGANLLWLAVLIGDMGASLLVILNAMRVGRKKFYSGKMLPKK
ncbi:MAG: hypothetical protein KAQ77_06775, partial [Candidatus Heimdallarchaeota archaeon]|nr:hypothetical protein [Candidatus Heimdallarchaeota archaeon]